MWGSIALVVLVVGVVVGVSQLSSISAPTGDSSSAPRPVSATVLQEITHVPTAAYDAAGTGIAGGVSVPRLERSTTLLTKGGKPEVFYLSGDFCPYCAAERWAVITALARFGTFSGLRTMQSSSTDIYPKTQTFEFNDATYTSPYITATLLELYGQDRGTGTPAVIHTLTEHQRALVQRFDSSGPNRSGTIPFSDWGNRVVFSGATYSPSVLQGLSRSAIASSLASPGSLIAKLILGSSNFMSAAVCAIDGGKPGSVCTSAGVEAAARALGTAGS